MRTIKDMAKMYLTVFNLSQHNDAVSRAELGGWLNSIRYLCESDAEYKQFTDELARLRKE